MAETPDSLSERTPKKSEWSSRIISALLGILVTVLGALILGKLQAREPHLVYSATEALPFSGQNGNVSIYQISVSNDGKREIYDVACVIRVPGARVDQYKLTANPLLNASATILGDSINVQIPNLNPAESAQISLLVTSSISLPPSPEITARGRGINGTQKNITKEEPTLSGLFTSTLAAASVAVALSGVFFSILRRRWRSDVADPGGPPGDEQRHILAYLCRVYGLRDLADQYSAQSHKTTYWAEADRFGQLATDDPGGERAAAIERVLLGLLDYNPRIARTSIAIVYYNLALINRAKKDELAYQKYLTLAKGISKIEIERRLQLDRRFTPSSG